MTKEQIQQKAVEYMREYKTLMLMWATGLGKSKAAIDIMKDMNKKNPDFKALLVVAEIAHINNWLLEFEKWNWNQNKCLITTYASLKHQKNTKWDLIILDEAHHSGSDIRLDILSTIQADKVLGLSATMDEAILMGIVSIFGGNYKLSMYTMQDAISLGILPKPSIYLVPMELDTQNPTQTFVEEWGLTSKKVNVKCDYKDIWEFRKNRDKYPNIRLEVACTEYQKYWELNSKMEYWKKIYTRTRTQSTMNKWLQTGSERKRFLGSLKQNKAREVLKLIEDKRFICFCSSIEQAEILGGKNAIHSKKDNSLDIIDDFNQKKIDSLYAIGMLQEGQNLVDIQAGVIIQLDGKERGFVQKMGRAMRAERPIVFILYFKDTQDEKYLKQATEDLDADLIEEVKDLKALKI